MVIVSSVALKVLVVGRSARWRESTHERLRAWEIDAAPAEGIEEALARLRRERDIDCVLLAADRPHEPWLSGLARIVLVRPDLPVVVLADSYDPGVMADYLRLGRRPNGSLVHYQTDTDDYQRLAEIIRAATEAREPG